MLGRTLAPLPDEAQVTRINSSWDILRAKPAAPAGWRQRVATFVWELLEPILGQQQEFNSAIVDHINRNIQPQRETVKSIETTIALIREQITALVAFHSTLMQYLQRITPFVNSKDYEFAALARRTYEDGEQQIQSIARTQRALSASIQGLSNELLKQVESLRSHVLQGSTSQRVSPCANAAHSSSGLTTIRLPSPSRTTGIRPSTSSRARSAEYTSSVGQREVVRSVAP